MERKLTCLIKASITIEQNKLLGKTNYVFGRCIISVRWGAIVSIRWEQKYPKATKELNTLFALYEQYGLNKDGNKIIALV